jgi:hypothetical protein
MKSKFLSNFLTELHKEDKIKHMTWSFWLAFVGMVFFSTFVAIAIVFLIGLLKEIWDKYYGSGFCYYDLIGNTMGITAAALITIAPQWLAS